jgi:hypothetical protein
MSNNACGPTCEPKPWFSRVLERTEQAASVGMNEAAPNQRQANVSQINLALTLGPQT